MSERRLKNKARKLKYGVRGTIKGQERLWCYMYRCPCKYDEHPYAEETYGCHCEDCQTGTATQAENLAKRYSIEDLACDIEPMSLSDVAVRLYDAVNHPEHYNQGGIEFIDALESAQSEEEHNGYLQGNAMKYLWRYQHKGKALEDLKKARWYLNRLIAGLEDDHE